MRIGAPKAKAVDAGTARLAVRCFGPRQRRGGYFQPLVEGLDFRVELVEMLVWENCSLLQGQGCLDQAG